MKKAFCLLIFATALASGCNRGSVNLEGAELEALQLEKVNMVIPEPPPSPGRSDRIYTVQRGDTLWHIAQKFYGDGKKYRLIIQANNITDPGTLAVGRKLIIPW